MKKVILVDGNNLLFRSYYATAYQGVIMRNSKGFPTNALYGFINMMNKIVKEENPNYILVAFDKGKSFRHTKYDFYKGGRNATPDELKEQFPKAKEVLNAMGIKYFEIDNYEADDIIGTVARIVDEEDKFIATIVSSDKDLLQLISDEVDVKLLKTSGFIRMDREGFINTYGVEPIRMIDLKALMGDSSDNIPGVKGIGEKTAISLLTKYKDLNTLYENIENVTGKTKEKLINDKDNAYMSYEMATIYRNVPLDFELEDLKYNGLNMDEYVELLKEFEFNSLLRKLDVETDQNEIEKEEEKVETKELKIKNITEFTNDKDFSYYIEMDSLIYSKSNIIGIGVYDGDYGYYIDKDNIHEYKEIFSSIYNKFTYDLKKNIVSLNELGIKEKNTTFDLMIAGYLLNYNIKDDISYLASDLGYNITNFEEMYGTEKRRKEVEEEQIKTTCIEKAKFIYEVKDKMLKELESEEEKSLFEDIEMPLSRVLADMEITGIRVDSNYLDEVACDLKKHMEILEKAIYEDAGCEFNIMSPLQLGNILFENLGIKYPKRIKEGQRYLTNKEVLDKIIDCHPIVEKILEYRTLTKLYTNYAVGLKNEIKNDGKIHTIFTQTLTRTGRLSSVNPNLQNIPARDEFSRLIRKAFIPEENSVLLTSDYSQVELRIFSAMSNATNLIDAFKNDQDIHAKTASDIFHVPIEEVTKDMRRTAKAVNFGILYGISSFGLSEDLGIDIKTAKTFIDNYLETYPGIKEYMDQEKNEAYKNGYVKTLMNRKRVIEELESKNFMVRSAGERIALNTPIQGTAADILKKAMVEIYDKFKEKGLKSKMLLQVHDELVFNVVEEELDIVKEIVKVIMENTYTMSVPLRVEMDYGKDWYEAK